MVCGRIKQALFGLATHLCTLIALAEFAPAQGLPPQHGGPVSYKLHVADGNGAALSLYAEERGSGSPVVLIHGLGGSTYSWRYVAPALARSHRVIALDLKGFGRSDKVFDTHYSAADQARLVTAFLAQRGLRNVTLVGHSFGGSVALLAAIQLQQRDPNRIRQLVLIDAPVLPQPLTPVVAFLQQSVFPYALVTAIPPGVMTRLALARTVDQPLARHYTEADADAYAAPLYDPAARHAYIQTARQIAPTGLRSLLKTYRSVHQRTLLVWCTADEIVPLSTGQRVVGMLPNARLTQLDGCNHAPTDEAPSALILALTRFLNR